MGKEQLVKLNTTATQQPTHYIRFAIVHSLTRSAALFSLFTPTLPSCISFPPLPY